MSAEIDIYETKCKTEKVYSGNVAIITKSCYNQQQEYLVTEVYEIHENDDYSLLDVIDHPDDADEVYLLDKHNSVVTEWSN